MNSHDNDQSCGKKYFLLAHNRGLCWTAKDNTQEKTFNIHINKCFEHLNAWNKNCMIYKTVIIMYQNFTPKTIVRPHN